MDNKKNIRLEVANDMYDVLRDIQDQRRKETGRKTSLAMIALEFLQEALENEELGDMFPKPKQQHPELNGMDHESMQSAVNEINVPPFADNTIGEKPIVEMKEAELLIEEDGRILKFDDVKTLRDYYKMKKAQLLEASEISQIQFANSEYRRILSTQKGRILTIFSNEGLILMDAAHMID